MFNRRQRPELDVNKHPEGLFQSTDTFLCFLVAVVLRCHPERHGLLLWLRLGPGGQWRRAAVARRPPWRRWGRGSYAGVTWPWDFGGGLVFLFIRRVAAVRHQTCSQSFHYRLWKKEEREKKKKKEEEKRQGAHLEKRGGGRNHRPAARVTENVLGGNETLMDFNFISATIGWWLGPFKRAAGRRHRSSGAPTPNQYPASRQRHMEEKKTQKKRKTQKQERFLLAKEKKGKETQQVIRTRRYGGDWQTGKSHSSIALSAELRSHLQNPVRIL